MSGHSSYFDILFAINELPHLGEKKLIKIAQKTCKYLPNKMEENVFMILSNNTTTLLSDINDLVDNLDDLLKRHNL